MWPHSCALEVTFSLSSRLMQSAAVRFRVGFLSQRSRIVLAVSAAATMCQIFIVSSLLTAKAWSKTTLRRRW